MSAPQPGSLSTGVTLILVVRNEEEALRAMLSKIPFSAFEDSLALDGNSVDQTVSILERAGIRTCRQQERGLGAARIEAVERVETTHFVFFSPDGNEDPADLPRIAEMLRNGAQFVVASRMVRGGRNEEDDKLLKWRKYANQGFAILANLFFAHGGNRTTDVTNAMRGMSRETWDRMRITSRDLTVDFQMVIRALKLGIPITEFPTREGDRIGGKTNFASIPTGIAELKLLLREIRLGLRTVDGGGGEPA
jgi:glycosyltransferase involved in cell wall biosynthesis